jgi:formate hydrogenlyase subunit 6/NADH:ubiquinone oxidoreductase subunit I
MKVRIDYAICNSCGLCREVCPESAIRPTLLEPRHLYQVQELKCTGCGECLEYCPAPGALVHMRRPEHTASLTRLAALGTLSPLAGRGMG